METLKFLHVFNIAVVVLMTLAYFYQYLYLIVGLIFKKVKPLKEASKNHRFATLISARNEEAVIADLVKSLKEQDYPSELFDVYVLADNCDDKTADEARKAGAIVYERTNAIKKGKGYALDYLIKAIKERVGESYYDGYFVFDADNIVDKNFVKEMNKTFDSGYDIITGYRNSKNFGTNWISASYSLWFLREARFLNYPRMLLGNSCMVSGTGFFVSQKIIDENNGWPYHLLTEDIQFSVNSILNGHKIGYCDSAIIYDEQPVTFKSSWDQRIRWSKGFFQVNGKYLPKLLKGVIFSKDKRMSCFDVCMTIVPCIFLIAVAIVVNAVVLFSNLGKSSYIAQLITSEATRYLVLAIVNYYTGLVFFAALTVAAEWKRIPATTSDKLRHLWMFPIFMASYIPITFAALRKNVTWRQIKHYASPNFAPETPRK